MRSIQVLAVVGLTLALSSCAGSAYPALDRPATEQDALPSDFDNVDLTDLVVESARYETSYQGTSFYIVRAQDGGLCLAASAGADSIFGCSTTGAALGISGMGFDAQLVPGPARDGDGYVAVSTNIRVKP